MPTNIKQQPFDFSKPVEDWFNGSFASPTEVQVNAWETIGRGSNALVIAPTGSGKTLAAFLFFIDRLLQEKTLFAQTGEPWKKGVRILYVSPLKALGADVERNLRKPLQEILERLAAIGEPVPEITVGMRTGDTDPRERSRMLRKPPDILITTPESLYLMLTSQARQILSTVETVIVDEVHSMAGSKRGSHLSLSLERLDMLLDVPAQRVGLSATIRPRQTAADFLGGIHPVEIVATDDPPALDISVRVPVSDMTSIPTFQAGSGYVGAGSVHGGTGAKATPSYRKSSDVWKTDRSLKAALAQDGSSALNKGSSSPDTRVGSSSIWPYLEAAIFDEICAHRSTIVFVNSRGLCERLTTHLNELYAKREGRALPLDGAGAQASSFRSAMGSSTELVQDTDVYIAKAHHGSVSKERRQAIEEDLKTGKLPCVVATSSLELGIDMGEVDLVLQVAPPLSISSGLQRIGRANHQVGGRSVGIIYPRVRNELIDAAVVTEGMLAGAIEQTMLVENALDVLAQQTAAETAMAHDGLDADAWLAIVRRSACYRNLTEDAYESVIQMLAGRYATGDAADFAPRLLFDPQTRSLKPLPRTQRLAVMSAGTIPDRGLYPVMTHESDGRGRRRRIGELDEEMVHESRIGDVIMLGTSSWRITDITKDRVLVEPSSGKSARLPFWHGEGVGRSMEDGKRRGAFLREAERNVKAAGLTSSFSTESDPVSDPALAPASASDSDSDKGADSSATESAWHARLDKAGLDENAQRNLTALIQAQILATGCLPTDKTIVVERTARDTGEWQMIVHAPFGRRVHEPWALAVSMRIQSMYGYDPQAAASDDGILLNIPCTEDAFPDASVLLFDPDDAVEIIASAVGSTSLFAARFRECAARALLMNPIVPGKRVSLWQQRQRGAQLLEEARAAGDFPILAEAARECLTDVYDLDGFKALMEALESGSIKIRSVQTDSPSPFAAPLLFGYVAEHLYDGDLPVAERTQRLLSVDSALLGELMGSTDILTLLDADVIATVEGELQHTLPDRWLSGAEGVAELLRIVGPLSVAQIACRLKVEGTDAAKDADALSTQASADVSGNAVPETHASEASVQELLNSLAKEHRVFQTRIGGRTVWATAEDATRLNLVSRADIPAWASLPDGSNDADAVSKMLTNLIARYGRTHSLFTSEEVADNLGIGRAVAESGIEALEREGKLRRVRKSSDGTPALWVDNDILKKLRLRSLAKARAAVQPIGANAYVRYVLSLQGLLSEEGETPSGMDALADTISLFEGVPLPAKLWESSVFPLRVADYAPAMLDELLRSGEVVWVGSRSAKASSRSVRYVTFFPTDSPAAPEPIDLSTDYYEEVVDEPGVTDGFDASDACDISDDPGAELGVVEGVSNASDGSISQEIVRTLMSNGPLAFVQISDSLRMQNAENVHRDPADAPENGFSVAHVAKSLVDLVWDGRVIVDDFSLVRKGDTDLDQLDRQKQSLDLSAAPRRVSSRRGYRRDSATYEAKRQARQSVLARSQAMDTLKGTWSAVIRNSENPSVQVLADVESLFDRYGLITRDISVAGGLAGGLQRLYPVLRYLEDNGEALRGRFVDGLGPSQFADKHSIEAMRRFTDEHMTGAVVLDMDDPAQLFGTVLPWPEVSHVERPKRQEGSLVVIVDGAPAMLATRKLKTLTVFTDDENALRKAVEALYASVSTGLRKQEALARREKLLIETINGESALASPFADMFLDQGFVRDPRGLRLYIDPF